MTVLHLADAREVDERRSVDADEARRVEDPLELTQPVIGEVAARADVQPARRRITITESGG